MIDKLTMVVQALNNIEVKGSQNMSNILGSINIINEVIAELRNKTEEE